MILRIIDGVAWGIAQNGQTFDLPASTTLEGRTVEHVVGDEVIISENEAGEPYIMIVGETVATALFYQPCEDGMQLFAGCFYDKG